MRLPSFALVALLIACTASNAAAQAATFVPEVGQPGKDVVWVPTPAPLVEKMLDMAKVGPSDFVIDLGSGDGRNVIAAARRGARGLGVEWNQDMVELSRRTAATAGVAERAQFEQGDMFKADISRATVMALFLLPSNMLQLRPKFQALTPGSRIVSNTFLIEGWTPDTSDSIGNCEMWCEAHLWIVPAQIGGHWTVGNGTLEVVQTFQKMTGTLTEGGAATPISGQLRGAEVEFTAAGQTWRGRAGDKSLVLTRPDGSTVTARPTSR